MPLTIETNGFDINFQKVRVQCRNMRQVVTGLVVNKKVNINKKYIRTTRAMIHQWQYDKENAALKFIAKTDKTSYTSDCAISTFRKHIYGRLSFLKMVKGGDSPIYIKLMSKMASHDTVKTIEGYRAMKLTKKYDVFICHAGEDKSDLAIPIYDALTKEKINAFIDHEHIKLGDSIVNEINKALTQAKYVIAILTKNSVDKAWPLRELYSVISTELNNENTRLIPVVKKGDQEIITEKLPLIADKKYYTFEDNADILAKIIKELINEYTSVT